MTAIQAASTACHAALPHHDIAPARLLSSTSLFSSDARLPEAEDGAQTGLWLNTTISLRFRHYAVSSEMPCLEELATLRARIIPLEGIGPVGEKNRSVLPQTGNRRWLVRAAVSGLGINLTFSLGREQIELNVLMPGHAGRAR